jgi:hypothetical protein
MSYQYDDGRIVYEIQKEAIFFSFTRNEITSGRYFPPDIALTSAYGAPTPEVILRAANQGD